MKKRQLLLSLQKRNNERLLQIRSLIEGGQVNAEEVAKLEEEVEEINAQLQEIADDLAELDAAGDDSEGEGDTDGADNGEGRDGEPEGSSTDGDGDTDPEGRDGEPEERDGEPNGISPEQRSRILGAVGAGLSTKGNARSAAKDKQVRKAFANFVVGKITESEARSLGVEVGNGSVTIPESIAAEIITYSQEENLLRKYGSTHRTKGGVKYPVLVKKAVANVTKTERTADMPETDIEFDEILLDPAEFDALATVTKKLIKMSGVDVEEIVIDELKKAYVEKETNYMFNGDTVGHENPGALAKKAVPYYETETVDLEAAGLQQKLYQQLVKFKGQAPTAVLKKAMWIVNRAAFTSLEGLLDGNGRPMLYEAPDGMGYRLLGYKLDFTDAANGADPSIPVFYFGDFKSFHIQDVIGALELQKLVEKFSGTNKIGFQIYNLLDGQLIYSPLEPTVFRYEVNETAPVGP